MQLLEFERTTNAFNFVFERNLTENEVVIEGKVEKKRSSVKIEVDRIRFAN